MALSPVMVELRANIREFSAKMAEARGEVAKLEKQSGTHLQKFQAFGKAAAAGIAVAVAGIGYESVKMAGDFQASTLVLQTAAGESAKGLKLVRAGILDIAKSTGTTWQNLSEGMYQVEKAGYRGADGLKILTAAAQGAKEENAQLSVVTNAMTSVMASYNIPAGKSVQVMNALKTAAAGSKDTMENFAGSLSTVLPIASAAHLSFAQVGGALAALTRHGTTSKEATQELAFSIRNILGPSKAAQDTMAQFGISAVDVSQKLGQRGLAGTMTYLTDAIAKHVEGGLVQIDTMRKSAAATDDLKRMTEAMSPAARVLGSDLMNNTISVKEFRKGIAELDPSQTAMARQFATLELKTRGFSDAIKSGQPAQTTMDAILKKITGGAVGLSTALMLTGSSADYADGMTKRITASMNDSSKTVEGWSATQKSFNNQMDRFRQAVEVVAIKIGTYLIPVLSTVMDFMEKHKTTVLVLAVAIGTVLVAAAAAFVVGFVAANSTIILVTAGVVALAAGFMYAWKRSETFRTVVITAFKVVSLGVLGVIDGLLRGIDLFARGSDAVFGTHFHKKVKGAISDVEALINKIQHIDDKTVTVKVVAQLDPALHSAGFMGPTVAEGLAARGINGPYTPQQTGHVAGAIPRSQGSGASVHVYVQGHVIGAGGEKALAERIRRHLSDANSRGQHLGLV